jgi:hypothetical protein
MEIKMKATNPERPLYKQPQSYADSAIDGLLSGVAAGLAMAIFLVVAGWLSGQGIGATLARFTLEGTPQPATGALTHLAVSGVYGLLFGLAVRLAGAFRWAPPTLWLLGAGFGIALWLFASLVFLTGTAVSMPDISAGLLAGSHLVYGVALGALSGRRS